MAVLAKVSIPKKEEILRSLFKCHNAKCLRPWFDAVESSILQAAGDATGDGAAGFAFGIADVVE